MPKLSKDSAPNVQDTGPAVDRNGDLDDTTVDFVTIRQSHSLASLRAPSRSRYPPSHRTSHDDQPLADTTSTLASAGLIRAATDSLGPAAGQHHGTCRDPERTGEDCGPANCSAPAHSGGGP
jgi:hypothetical protein